MEVLKLQETKPTTDAKAMAASGKSKKSKEPTEAPAVAEFLLALAHSHPTSDAKGSAAAAGKTPTATVTSNMTQKLGGRIISRSPGAPIRPRPLPEYLTLTRIPPLLFAEKLLRHENVPLEHYFPDQFDVELANYEPSDHDIICGRGRGNFSHIGNQKLLDIIRERQDDYLKSNKRGKGALGKQILLEILMNGGRFIKLKDKDGQVWRVLSHKDVNTKIMHCIRDQINFNRRSNMSRDEDDDDEEEPRGTKHPMLLDSSPFAAPNKRMKTGPKKLSSYLKMKYAEEHPEAKAGKELSPQSEAGHALARPFGADIQAIPTPRMPIARSQAEKPDAQSADAAAAARLEAQDDEMASLRAFAMAPGMAPGGLHSLIAKKEAELAALRAAMMGEAGMAGMMPYSSLMPSLGPSPLDIKQSMILARAELAAAGLRDPLADRFRLASMMNQDAFMADHLRQVALRGGGMNPYASLLGGMQAPAPLGAGFLPEGESPAAATSAKSE